MAAKGSTLALSILGFGGKGRDLLVEDDEKARVVGGDGRGGDVYEEKGLAMGGEAAFLGGGDQELPNDRSLLLL